uniref:F-box/FBD/LRR-repeat protein At1g13570-like n=1 Tax=Erigeron canadensis TaxID=72917 RepID=UPI001CB8C9BB|nr:F-box/FBD/LRR-repeat protein At1g13570-like [Erigeron canadensis]
MEVVKSMRGLAMDIISTLPQDITTRILSRMPIRDALRTSILSRKWRYCWRRVSTISFEDKMFEGLNYSKEIMKHKVANAIFHVLLLHTSPLLKFSLSIDVDMESELDQIIIYLSRSDTLQELSLENNSAKHYKLPCSFFSLRELWYLRVTNFHLGTSLTSNGFSKLTCLTLTNVEISSHALKYLLTNCPLLGELYLLGDEPKMIGENSVTSVELYECLPSIQKLGFSEYYLKYFGAGGMPHKLPNSSFQVKYLILSLCLRDRDALSSALYLIKNSPNLTTLSIKTITRPTSTDPLDLEDYSDLKLDHLHNLWMHGIRNLDMDLKFLKLVLAKAPVLKKAFMELDYNLPLLSDLQVLAELTRVPFPCASSSAQLFIERPNTSPSSYLPFFLPDMFTQHPNICTFEPWFFSCFYQNKSSE